MSARDDLLLEMLEEDPELAWRLAEAAATPAPAVLRGRIVARHRRLRVWTVPRIALAWAAAAAALVVALAFGSGARAIALNGGAAEQRAAVIATAAGDGYLIMALPTPPAGKTYEAWVIRDGEPLAAGLTNGTGILTLRSGVALRAGDVIAITVEVAAGASRPTSVPILVGKL
jgi:hypothetical protein